jgi:hypothetical protein
MAWALSSQDLTGTLACPGYPNKTPLHHLNNRNSFSHSSGDWKSKIKVLAGLVSGETSLPCLLEA